MTIIKHRGLPLHYGGVIKNADTVDEARVAQETVAQELAVPTNFYHAAAGATALVESDTIASEATSRSDYEQLTHDWLFGIARASDAGIAGSAKAYCEPSMARRSMLPGKLVLSSEESVARRSVCGHPDVRAPDHP